VSVYDHREHKVTRRNFCPALSCVGACVFVVAAGLLGMSQGFSPAPARKSQIVNDFGARVTRYLEVRKNEAGTPPKPTNSPKKLADSREQMAAKLRAARADAKQGDIFTPEIAEYFRHQIAAMLNGPHGARIRASLRHAEPVQGMPLQVNQTYPNGVPLQSMPPTLLLNLPRLPKELEYRIVGHDLVLHDITANIVVDFVPNAIPPS